MPAAQLRLLVVLPAILLAGCGPDRRDAMPLLPDIHNRPWTIVEDAPIRGNVARRQIALVFTGGDFGEGAKAILDQLAERGIQASFFVTGDFLRQPALASPLRRMLRDGHYLGPHSHAHLLYCSWEDRSRTLVTERVFVEDLRRNIDELRKLGALAADDQPVYFIPPYEWYNREQSAWARRMGVLLFNFTPGSGSNRDWAPEGHKSFVPSTQIVDDILAFERKDPNGLNGFILLLHLGSQRQDKMHPHVGRLIDALRDRGYAFIRIDQMLPTAEG